MNDGTRTKFCFFFSNCELHKARVKNETGEHREKKGAKIDDIQMNASTFAKWKKKNKRKSIQNKTPSST